MREPPNEEAVTRPLTERRSFSTKPLPPSSVAGLGGCSVTIDRAWRVTGISPAAAAWFGVSASDLLGADSRERIPVNPPVFDAMISSFSTGEARQARARSVLYPGLWLEFKVFPVTGGMGLFFRQATGQPLDNIDGQAAGVLVNAAWRSRLTHLKDQAFGVGTSYVDLARQVIPDSLRAFGPRFRQVRIQPSQVGRAADVTTTGENRGEVARVQADLRRTSEQLLSAQEDERERIAVELHDSTGQHLAALGLGVARLQRLVGARRGVREVLDEMAQALQEAHREIRVLSYLLKPPGALEGGLEATVRRFVKGFGNRTGLHTSFRVEGEPGMMIAGVEHAAFRVIQEALSNVHRHAEATGVGVDLITRGDLLTIRVADDGRGIESVRNGASGDIPLGVGIAGMRARVEQLGGALDIACNATGTVVTASIPIPCDPIGSDPVFPHAPSKETPNGSGLLGS